jgi:hypothetical protein
MQKAGVPEDLIKLWLGHSQSLIDLYAAPLRVDEGYRREWCERAGLGYSMANWATIGSSDSPSSCCLKLCRDSL